jgi:hypothetical protein
MSCSKGNSWSKKPAYMVGNPRFESWRIFDFEIAIPTLNTLFKIIFY